LNHYVLHPLSYCASLQEQYQKLSHLPGFVLLESTDRSRGRYDILSAYPYDSIKIQNGNPHYHQVFSQLKETLLIQNSVADLPFQGGAIGYISYDFGAQKVGIYSRTQPTLTTMPLLELGLYDWAIIVDHELKKITLFAGHTQCSTSLIVEEVLSLWHQPFVQSKCAQLSGGFIPLVKEAAYKKAFSEIYLALRAGRCYQVNFTQPFQTSYEGDSWSFYKKISSKNPVPFSAFLRTSEADILSFSPERFLLYNQGKLLTSPIKGTLGRSKNLSEDEYLKQQLIMSEKNRAENVMIVDLLRNDLGKISMPGSVQVRSLCEVESYHSVHHLVSTIESQCLPRLHPFEVFLSCFPGGSITGAPKRESMQVIHEQEVFSRGVYCGAIGYFSRHGYFDTNVAIRTITAKDNKLHLAAGGGIVIDSQAEEEYKECFIKIAAIIDGLN
jgi:para-aminobenzoate synthetase component 1